MFNMPSPLALMHLISVLSCILSVTAFAAAKELVPSVAVLVEFSERFPLSADIAVFNFCTIKPSMHFSLH